MNELARFIKGKGIRLHREDGEVFIDAESGTFNLSLGHSHPSVVDAAKRQIEELLHLSAKDSQPYVDELLTELLSMLPEGSTINDGWFRDLTGSSAVECAIKTAQKFTGRNTIVSVFLSHHGQSSLTTAMSGNTFRRRSMSCTRSADSLVVPGPYCYRCHFKAKYPSCGLLCVEKISDYIEHGSNDDIAAMIVEPVLGNGGNILPPPGYFEAVRRLCDEHGMLLIADEAQTGVGRLGYGTGSEALGIQPNIITLAKGISGIGIPTAAVLMEKRLKVLEPHEHSHTSGSHLLGIAASMATLKIINRPEFLQEVRRKGKLLQEKLEALKERHNCIGDVRGLGLMFGLEIVDNYGAQDIRRSQAIISAAFNRERLILRDSRSGYGSVIKIRPALIVTDEEIEEIVHKLERAIVTTHGYG